MKVENAVSRGLKVGPVFTETASPSVGPQDALATPVPKVGPLVHVALRSDSRTPYLPKLVTTGPKVGLRDTIASLNVKVRILLSY